MKKENLKNAKLFLKKAGDSKVEARRCSMRLQETWEDCCRVTAQLELAPTGNANRADGVWAAYADLKLLLKAAYENALRQEKQVEELLQKITDPAQRAVLTLRYQQLLSWPLVQERMRDLGLYYEERQIYNIHDAALLSVSRLLN